MCKGWCGAADNGHVGAEPVHVKTPPFKLRARPPLDHQHLPCPPPHWLSNAHHHCRSCRSRGSTTTSCMKQALDAFSTSQLNHVSLAQPIAIHPFSLHPYWQSLNASLQHWHSPTDPGHPGPLLPRHLHIARLPRPSSCSQTTAPTPHALPPKGLQMTNSQNRCRTHHAST